MKRQVSIWVAVFDNKQMSHLGSIEGKSLGKIGSLKDAWACELIGNIGIFSAKDLWGSRCVSILSENKNYPSILGDDVVGDVGEVG